MTSKPNVVVMLSDNVGVGGLSCYGGTIPTPRLDRLASEGIRFTNHNTEAQCTPTRSALMTGRMPLRSGTFRVPLPGEPGHYGLAPWEYTAADLFSDAGYATACFGWVKLMILPNDWAEVWKVKLMRRASCAG